MEPVNDNDRMSFDSSSALPTPFPFADVQHTTLNTPFGTPARSASAARFSAEMGVALGGFRTLVQPTESAAAILRVIIAMGKFHEEMKPTTPTGCRTVISWRDSGVACDAMVCPRTCLASSANQRTKLAPYCTSPRDSRMGLPLSIVITRASSSRFSIKRSYRRRRISLRSYV